jgi:hypothetical protein
MILLVAVADGRVLAGPVAGVLCNISEMGACIEVESPLASARHIFYETLNDPGRSLVIEGVVPSKDPSLFSVTAFSVWMNTTEEERPPGFRIGLQFRERQAQLFRRFKRL